MTEKQAKLEKRDKEIVKDILRGHSFKKMMRKHNLSRPSIYYIKSKYIPKFQFPSMYIKEDNKPAGPLTFKPNPEGLTRMGICILRYAMIEFMQGGVSAEDLNQVGKNFGLERLAERCRKVWGKGNYLQRR